MTRFQLLRAWSGRLLRGAMGASLAGLFAAALDAAWARGQSDDTQRSSKLLSLLAADAGLVAPIALLTGLFVAAALVFVSPNRAPSLATLIDSLRARAKGRPADIAAFVPLTILAAFFWMTFSAQLARALLGLDIAAPLAGLSIAIGALVSALLDHHLGQTPSG